MLITDKINSIKCKKQLIYHVISFRWQMFFQIVRIFMNLTNLRSCLFFNLTLILMKLFLIPSGITSMHQRVDPVNTLCMPFYGHLLFSGFFPFRLIHYLLFTSEAVDIVVSKTCLCNPILTR